MMTGMNDLGTYRRDTQLVALGATTQSLCKEFLADLRQRLGLQLATVWSLDPVHGRLMLLAADGEGAEELGIRVLTCTKNLSGLTVARRVVTWFEDIALPVEGRVFGDPELAARLSLKTMISIPVLNTCNLNQVLLVLNLFPRAGSPELDDAGLMQMADAFAADFEIILNDQCFRCANRLAQAIGSMRQRTREDLFRAASHVLRTSLDCDAVKLYHEKGDPPQLVCESFLGPAPLGESIDRIADKMAGVCWRKNREVVVPDLEAEDKSTLSPSRQPSAAASGLFVPLRDLQGKARGVLCCLSPSATVDAKRRRVFTYEDVTLAEAISRALIAHLEIVDAEEIRIDAFNRLAHELRVPVVAVRAAQERVQRECSNRGYIFEYEHFGEMSTYMEVMKRLLLKLDILRKGPGRIVLELKLTRIFKDIIAPAKRFVAPLAARRGLDSKAIRYSGMHAVKEMYLDRALMTEVVFNLLDNAIKYYGEDPGSFEIVIEGRQRPGGFEICFRDNGVGVPEGLKERIFEAGFRGPQSHEFDAAGGGLGLWFAREIVRLHNGSLTLRRNSGPTEFVVFLPRALTAAPPARGELRGET